MAIADRRGVALIDALVALVILGTTGVGLITLLGQNAHSMRSVRETEREVQRATDELGRLATLDRQSIAALEGKSDSHGWLLAVTQIADGLFDVSIARADSGARSPLLRTTIYRPASDASRAGEP